MGKFKSLIEGSEMSADTDVIDSPADAVHNPNIPHLEIVSRVAKLPVVESAISYAGDSYGRVKNAGPPAVQKSVSWAEALFAKFMNVVMAATVLFVQKFQGPVNSLDSLACNTFDKMTQKVPLITQPPEQIVTSTRSYFTETMEPFQSKLDVLYNYYKDMVSRAMKNPLAHNVLVTAGKIGIRLSEAFDYFVPPTTEEVEAGASPDLQTKARWIYKRVLVLLMSMRHRLLSSRIAKDEIISNDSNGKPNESLNVKIAPEKPLNIFLALAIRLASAMKQPLGLDFQAVPKSITAINGGSTKSKTNGSSASKYLDGDISSASEVDDDHLTNRKKKMGNKKCRTNEVSGPTVSHL